MFPALLLLLVSGLAWAGPDFQRWVERQQPPGEHPERAENWDFSATLFQRVDALVDAYPSVITAESIGRSVENRPIWAFRVKAPDTEVRQRVLIFAQLHSLEWIGAEVSVELLEQLVPAPPEHVEIVVVPIANPDGRWRSEQDLLADSHRSYRRANANGVDLNRDWAQHRDNDNIWSKLPFTRRYYYTSPAPLSQPETQALDALASEGFDVSVSLHAFGGYIYVPWAGRWAETPDHAELVALGEVMAEGMPGRPYRVMQLCHWIFFFRALGSELDHMYAVQGTQAFLIELTRSGIEPLRPSTWRDYFRWYNPVDPSADIADGVGALRALVNHLAWEERMGGVRDPQAGAASPQVRR